MSAIQSDAANTENLELTGDDSGVDEFLKSFLPPDALKKKPSEGTPESNVEETKPEEKTEDETTSDESPEETESDESSEDEKAEERKYADDGVYVKVKVGDTEHEVPVKDLQRLFGQEASLTQKSQQVAEERKQVEAELAKNTAATQALLERAKARFEPYSKVDFLLAAQQLSPEEYTALRNEATKAYEDVQFLEQHLGSYMQHINSLQQQSLRERAALSLKELSSDDAEKGIPGFNEKMYDELRVYATTKFGVPQDIMNNLVDGWAVRVLYKAMLYDRGKDKVVTTRVNKTPKKIVKTTTTPEASRANNASSVEKAMQKLKSSGSTDDVAEAFLARWNDDA